MRILFIIINRNQDLIYFGTILKVNTGNVIMSKIAVKSKNIIKIITKNTKLEFFRDHIIADGLKLSGNPKAINMLSENMFVVFDNENALFMIDLEKNVDHE